MPVALAPSLPQTKAEVIVAGQTRPRWSRLEQSVMVWSWVLVGGFGFLQAVANRFYVNPDGVSYADLADAYLRRDWHNALSAYWGPLYPLILSTAFRLFHPSAYFESTTIHLVNFFLYLISFGCLQFLICEFSAWRGSRSSPGDDVRFSRPALLVLGTVLFLVSAQNFMGLDLVTPDFCVMAFAFLASALVLLIERDGPDEKRSAALGAVLALGYLSKAAFFPLSFVFLGAALARRTAYRQALSHAGAALLAFALIAGPNIVAISLSKHSVTFGDTGKLNYIWCVDGASLTNLQTLGDAEGIPVHPTRKVFEHPDVYEFAKPVQGTYPIWFDPSYWHEGVRPKLVFGRQLRAIVLGWKHYVSILLTMRDLVFVGFLLLALQYFSGSLSFFVFAERWRVLAPCLAALLLYLPVYVEGRYVSPFLIVLCIGLASAIRLPSTSVSRAVFSAATLAVVFSTAINLYPGLRQNVRSVLDGSSNTSWEVAKALHEDLHLEDSDTVGCVGYCFDAYWARLAGLRIVSEIPAPQAALFANSNRSTQQLVLRAMAATGAKAVIADMSPGPGWQPLKGTSYFAYDLRHE